MGPGLCGGSYGDTFKRTRHQENIAWRQAMQPSASFSKWRVLDSTCFSPSRFCYYWSLYSPYFKPLGFFPSHCRQRHFDVHSCFSLHSDLLPVKLKTHTNWILSISVYLYLRKSWFSVLCFGMTRNYKFHIFLYFADRASQYIYLNINPLNTELNHICQLYK